MPWYFSTQSQVKFFDHNPGIGWFGPYLTEQAAQNALASSGGGSGGNGGGGGGDSGSGKWWIVQTFFSDGSSSWAVGTAKTGFAHPIPTANEIVFGPYPSQGAAQHAVDTHTFDQAPQKYYGSNVSKGPGGIPVPGVQAPGLPDILHGFNLGNWLLRIGEIVLGIVLIGVGVAHMTGVDNAVSKAVAKAGKVALLA